MKLIPNAFCVSLSAPVAPAAFSQRWFPRCDAQATEKFSSSYHDWRHGRVSWPLWTDKSASCALNAVAAQEADDFELSLAGLRNALRNITTNLHLFLPNASFLLANLVKPVA
jgi:hypothetical protein